MLGNFEEDCRKWIFFWIQCWIGCWGNLMTGYFNNFYLRGRTNKVELECLIKKWHSLVLERRGHLIIFVVSQCPYLCAQSWLWSGLSCSIVSGFVCLFLIFCGSFLLSVTSCQRSSPPAPPVLVFFPFLSLLVPSLLPGNHLSNKLPAPKSQALPSWEPEVTYNLFSNWTSWVPGISLKSRGRSGS